MMGNIDLRSIQGTTYEMALRLGIFIVVPFICAMFIKFVLRRIIPIPNAIANLVIVVICLFMYYEMIPVLG
jgi:hypothetical protein